MAKRFLAAALLVPAVAFAGGTANYAVVPYVAPATDFIYDIPAYEAEGHTVIDQMVNVYDDGADPDRWTTAYANAYFVSYGQCECNYSFWDHSEGGDTPGELGNPAFFGLVNYDSFWTCSEEFPNPDLAGGDATTFAPGSPIQNTATNREAEWYADPADPNAGAGDFVLARYNVMGFCVGEGCSNEYVEGWEVACSLVIEGTYFFENTGGQPIAYAFEIPLCWAIPEPGSLGLLVLGGLALLRRR